jgi:hypothetical protein
MKTQKQAFWLTGLQFILKVLSFPFYAAGYMYGWAKIPFTFGTEVATNDVRNVFLSPERRERNNRITAAIHDAILKERATVQDCAAKTDPLSVN